MICIPGVGANARTRVVVVGRTFGIHRCSPSSPSSSSSAPQPPLPPAVGAGRRGPGGPQGALGRSAGRPCTSSCPSRGPGSPRSSGRRISRPGRCIEGTTFYFYFIIFFDTNPQKNTTTTTTQHKRKHKTGGGERVWVRGLRGIVYPRETETEDSQEVQVR